MDQWDTPFSTNHFSNFASPKNDAKCVFEESDTSETASISDSSIEVANDNDTYAEFNPLEQYPVLSLTRILATVQVVGTDDDSASPYSSFIFNQG
jgi:hypothetical protein